jgi:hypothetical protein
MKSSGHDLLYGWGLLVKKAGVESLDMIRILYRSTKEK